jgi:hypothetical protein
VNAAKHILCRGARGLGRRARCLWSGRQPRQARKGKVRSRVEAANPPRRLRLLQLERSRNPGAFRPGRTSKPLLPSSAWRRRFSRLSAAGDPAVPIVAAQTD